MEPRGRLRQQSLFQTWNRNQPVFQERLPIPSRYRLQPARRRRRRGKAHERDVAYIRIHCETAHALRYLTLTRHALAQRPQPGETNHVSFEDLGFGRA
jgi:hypothetical protein